MPPGGNFRILRIRCSAINMAYRIPTVITRLSFTPLKHSRNSHTRHDIGRGIWGNSTALPPIGNYRVVGVRRYIINLAHPIPTVNSRVLMALARMVGGGELISDQLKLKGNNDAKSITEAAVLKVKETSRIRELYRAIYEIPENRAKLNPRRWEKLKTNGDLWGEIKKRNEVHIADQIDQLNALRSEMQSGKLNSSIKKAMGFWKMKWRVWGRDSERRHLHQIRGIFRGIEIGAIGKHGEFAGFIGRKYRMGSRIGGVCLRRGE